MSVNTVDKTRPNTNTKRSIKETKPIKGGMGKVFLIISFSIVLVVALCYILNIGNIKTNTISIYKEKILKEKAQDDVIEDNRKLLEFQQQQVDEKKKELVELEAKLNARSAELDQREQNLQATSAQIEADANNVKDEKERILSIAKIYESMEPSEAAKILMQYEDQNKVVQILKNLNNAKSAKILSVMAPSSASKLLQLMNSQ